MKIDSRRPNLSVIMPCRNGAATIAMQLEALCAQRWSKSWELIIVDNGSTDATRGIVARYQKRLRHLRVVDANDMQSCAYARNVGIRAAAADRFAFCDVDDIVEAGWIAAMGDALARHDFVASVICLDKLNEAWLQELWGTPSRSELPVCLGFLPSVSGCGFGITRGLYQTLGEFDETLSRLEDVDYSWRAQLAGVKIWVVSTAVVQYRHRQTLSGIYRQAHYDGVAQMALRKKFRLSGISQITWKQALGSCLILMRSIPISRERVRWSRWLVKAGVLFGRFQGVFVEATCRKRPRLTDLSASERA